VTSLPGKRSRKAVERRDQKRLLAKIINVNAFKDLGKSEVVNRLSGGDCIRLLIKEVDVVVVVTPDLEFGEVLSDSRGAGSQQVAKK